MSQAMKTEDCQYDIDWTEQFIINVQSRPELYDASLVDHSDKNLVYRLWEEIASIVFPTWRDMTPMQKNLKVKELQSKWKNLKTCFRRELAKQENPKPGQAKRRKYMYFDQMAFLLQSMQDRPIISKCETIENFEEIEDNSDEFHRELHSNTPEESSQSQLIGTKQNSTTYEDELLDILKDRKEHSTDEDKLFLYSVLPAFKKLTDNQKIDVKIEILDALKRASQNKKKPAYRLAHDRQRRRYDPRSNSVSDSESQYSAPENRSTQKKKTKEQEHQCSSFSEEIQIDPLSLGSQRNSNKKEGLSLVSFSRNQQKDYLNATFFNSILPDFNKLTGRRQRQLKQTLMQELNVLLDEQETTQ